MINPRNLTKKLKKIPADEWSDVVDEMKARNMHTHPFEVWCSKTYLVQLYSENNDVVRVSINYVKRTQGGWKQNITWDDIQQIKRDIGHGDTYAIEVYPRDLDVVNVSNMRHIWLLPEPLRVGWFKN